MEHNFRSNYWGHAQYLSPEPDGTFSGLVISTPTVKVGDTLVWCTEYGECVAEVTYAKWKGDPVDMSEVRVKIVERRVSEEILAHVDEHGEPPWEYTLLKETK